jgi:hypothetical protein
LAQLTADVLPRADSNRGDQQQRPSKPDDNHTPTPSINHTNDRKIVLEGDNTDCFAVL